MDNQDLELLEVLGQLEEAVVRMRHGEVDADETRGKGGRDAGEQCRLPHREPLLPPHLLLSFPCKICDAARRWPFGRKKKRRAAEGKKRKTEEAQPLIDALITITLYHSSSLSCAAARRFPYLLCATTSPVVLDGANESCSPGLLLLKLATESAFVVIFPVSSGSSLPMPSPSPPNHVPRIVPTAITSPSLSDFRRAELAAVVAKEDTALRATIPVRQRITVCVWRLAMGEPLSNRTQCSPGGVRRWPLEEEEMRPCGEKKRNKSNTFSCT
uniref:Uncharacterized protein n=1 Tax=Oryza glumipatula TaxID=40148 RepID=A0A0D9YWR7_9ORYZ